MKYHARMYAKALAEVMLDPKVKDDEVVRNFMGVLRKNGDEIHLRKILEEAAALVRGKSGIRKVTIESARPLLSSQKKLLGGFIKEGDVLEERINAKLIAGLKIIVNDETQLDQSLKTKLDKLFSI